MRRILFYFMSSILIADLYVGLFLLSGRPMVWQVLWWLPTIATFAGILMVFRWFTTGIFTFIIAMLLCLEIPKMLFAIFSVLGLATSFILPEAIPISNTVGILFAVAFSLTMLYGFIFGWQRLKVNEIMLDFENLPTAFDGYRIVQLSDLHLGSQSKKSAYIKKLVNKVNLLKADAIVFTGDLVNRSADEAVPFIPILSSLVAREGVYAILGNHDYPYPFLGDTLMEGSRKVVDVERRMGWLVLLNEHKILSRNGAYLAIVGVENIGKPPFPRIGNLEQAMQGIPQDAFTILLSHDPFHWRHGVSGKTDIPLTLSAHTHAGQLRIGNWSLAKPVYPDWCGLYQEGKQSLYVHQGTGTRVLFRLGTYAEITLITLHRKGSSTA